MHTAQCSSRANACAVGVADGTRFTGSRLLQAAKAVLNAGDDELIPGTLLKLTAPVALGSGKFGTPWERMHRLKLSPGGAAPVWLELEPPAPARVELLRDPEPHAASTTPAASATATDASDRETRVTAHVLPDHR